MYAVIKTGGKQYRVKKDDILRVELLDAKKGDKVTLNEVLMVGSADGKAKFGSPTISGASVSAEVLDQIRDDKVIVFKKKRRQNYRRKNGHRQNLLVLKITGITG
ncbi:MAG: 50S ribosomal protein L21 [Alphaproteobacteria bacterium]|jgi:large subunit ribosomal protein L21|nr:50S ribosomal protein L21 [Alphaproteobacteria bacterium]